MLQKALPLLESLFQPDLHLIGEFYQQILSAPLTLNENGVPAVDMSADSRRAGEFYTPAWVADYAFEQWLQSYPNAFNSLEKGSSDSAALSILDPSCGCGSFLLSALRTFRNRFGEGERLIEFAASCIYGKDVDGRAVELCKLSIILFLGESLASLDRRTQEDRLEKLLEALDRNIHVSDSLLAACAADDGRRYDLVITNPPYLSFGSRDQQVLGRDFQQFLKKLFPASSEYKIRLTSMFQEIAIKLISGDDGSAESGSSNRQCILLVPDAFLTGSYYEKLRRIISHRADIVGFTEFPESIISDATVGRWCLAHYKNKSGNSEAKVKLKSFVADNDSLSRQEFSLRNSCLISSDRHRFQLLFSEEDLEIVSSCRRLPWLGSVLKGHTGIRARNGQKSIVSSRAAGDNYFRGLISGAELKAFSINWAGNWLEIVPEKLFSGGFDKKIVCGPKVLLRQTGDRLIAAADCTGLYHLNNIHSFVPLQAGAREGRINFFTCLLNSSFMLYFYRLKTREFRRPLAQIDIETVEHLPLPHSNERLESELEYLGSCLSRQEGEKNPDLLAELDRLIFQIFQIDERLQAHIRNMLIAQAPVRSRPEPPVAEGGRPLIEDYSARLR